jgi:hypothetical protein
MARTVMNFVGYLAIMGDVYVLVSQLTTMALLWVSGLSGHGDETLRMACVLLANLIALFEAYRVGEWWRRRWPFGGVRSRVERVGR